MDLTFKMGMSLINDTWFGLIWYSMGLYSHLSGFIWFIEYDELTKNWESRFSSTVHEGWSVFISHTFGLYYGHFQWQTVSHYQRVSPSISQYSPMIILMKPCQTIVKPCNLHWGLVWVGFPQHLFVEPGAASRAGVGACGSEGNSGAEAERCGDLSG